MDGHTLSKRLIRAWHTKQGMSAQQIAERTHTSIEHIQAVLDEQPAPERPQGTTL